MDRMQNKATLSFLTYYLLYTIKTTHRIRNINIFLKSES